MENLSIYESIAERTQGDIYIGVVGPVRTGKSTFIKRFMDLLVIPNVKNQHMKTRIQDEMPQSGSGKTITTTEPKFIPGTGVPIKISDHIRFKVRMVDCVGYMVPGAMGHMEEGKTRMVATPWQEEKIPFEKAAEIGTRKVIEEHSTIGIVMTTDGSIGDIQRSSYIQAEEQVIEQMKSLEKPFVLVVNSTNPKGEAARDLALRLGEQYHVPCIAANCAKMSRDDLAEIMQEVLYQFPVSRIRFTLPGFMEGLSNNHWIKATIINNIKEWSETFENLKDIEATLNDIADGEIVCSLDVETMDLGKGIVDVKVNTAEDLFYKVLSELMDETITNDYEFFNQLKVFSQSKKAYDKLQDAIKQVDEKGYGIVQPKLSEMVLEEPEIFKQGNKYGIRLTAKAPSLHIIKTDITTEVAPIVGTEAQSEDLMKFLLDEFESNPGKIWETNIFGKSLYEMVTEQMENKLSNVPENIREKVQRSLQKISDEGKEYFICIVI